MTTSTVLNFRLIPSTLVACGTLLVYDILCTFDEEVAFVWSNPWSISSVIFLLNRYLPFVDTFLSLDLKLSMNSPEECLAKFQVVTWFIVTGILLSEVILMLRTYALWERRRSILISLCILGLLVFVPAMVVTHLELKSLQYVPSPYPGCVLGHASPIIIVAYILLVVSETTMAVLTAIQAYQFLRHSQSAWVVQLYQDGLLFYVYLLGISLANVIVPIVAPPLFANWLATPQRVLHSVLCNRVLLLIFRQRNASSMTTRRPLRTPNARGGQNSPLFTSFVEDETSISLTIIGPSVGMVSSSQHYDVTPRLTQQVPTASTSALADNT